MPFAATWMDLEIIILNEVSQTEKGIILINYIQERKIYANYYYFNHHNIICFKTQMLTCINCISYFTKKKINIENTFLRVCHVLEHSPSPLVVDQGVQMKIQIPLSI